MLSGLRGLAQSFVRGAVRLGRAAVQTFSDLTGLGLGYPREEFGIDYEKFARQDFLTDQVLRRDPDQLIPGDLHEVSLWDLTAKFKYDVEAVGVDIWGRRKTFAWSAIANVRQSLTEIMDSAAQMISGSPPEGYTIVEEPELVGIWTRQEEGG